MQNYIFWSLAEVDEGVDKRKGGSCKLLCVFERSVNIQQILLLEDVTCDLP
jgi:hypothetical protein